MAKLLPDGTVELDQTPVAVPVRFRKKGVSEFDKFKGWMDQMNRQAAQEGAESMEEFEDFDIPDDPVPISGFEYEGDYDHTWPLGPNGGRIEPDPVDREGDGPPQTGEEPSNPQVGENDDPVT